MTAVPLFQSVFVDLTRTGQRVVESYNTTEILVSAGTVSDTSLAAAGFPVRGEAHPSNANIVVTEVRASRASPTTTRLDFIYERPENDIFPQNDDQLGLADVSFSALPVRSTATVPGIIGSPLSTQTVELGENNEPTTEPPTLIGKSAAGFARENDTLDVQAHRITFTVSGLASQLGLSNTFGNVGNIPAITSLTDRVHLIGSVALLFNGVDVSWTGNRPEGRVYTISYDWTYEPGKRPETPDGFVQDPQVGPQGSTIAIVNAIGSFPPDANGDAFYGVASPSVEPPPSLAGRGHVLGNGARYTVVPYCDTRTRTDGSGDFAVPFYVSVPRYTEVDTDAEWQNFPGIGAP